jgi:hypothetical protein
MELILFSGAEGLITSPKLISSIKSSIFPVGAVFPNDNRMSDAEIDRQIKQFGRGDEAGWTLGTATGRGFRK